uniref:Uncharacterized protein n=1 Tax=Anguilla anguilla TaxID=7936 RepID=A0A0E9UNE8_ANGAN
MTTQRVLVYYCTTNVTVDCAMLY